MRIDTDTSAANTGPAPRTGATGPQRRRRAPSRPASARKRSRPLAETRAAVPAALLAADASTNARRAATRLTRSSDRAPGYTRRLIGKRFAYFDSDGARIRDADTIARIDSLAIPPAYTDVWICADACGHLQATGRDARGRKQYRYHPSWRDQRDRDKFAKLAGFADALPRIRARVAAGLRLAGLPRDKVIAAIVRLLDSTLVRIGSDEYVRDNASYGLTTLRKRHLRTDGSALKLCFNGKHGIGHEIAVTDPRVARVVRRCAELPGRELFRYVDGDGTRKVTAADVNAWLHEAGGDTFTAKDYRTWAASAVALALLRVAAPPASQRAARRAVMEATREVAALLRNTPAVCRNSYIHPAVVDAFASGALPSLRCRIRRAGLSDEERRLATLLDACTPR
ncbi:MAG TPA: DNA topoisomerase IB [Paraburkholderia sp.]|jgi:DNA topoisomerase-1|nr:DNA topoisomerase IB [Paraburkholderia sp.]